MFNRVRPESVRDSEHFILVYKKDSKRGPYYEYYAGPSSLKDLREWCRFYMSRSVHGESVLLARISRYHYDSDAHCSCPYGIVEIIENLKITGP